MLTHDEALQLLAARVDGELTAEQERTLEAWLQEHPEGRVLAEAFHAQDAELRGTFAPRRAAAARTAERIVELLPAAPTPVAVARPSRWRHFWHSLPPIACAAVLAFVFFFWIRVPEESRRAEQEVVRAEATERLLETAEVLVPKPKAPQPAVAVAAIGQQLKTGPADKRRVVLPDGSVLYLDQGTSAQLVSERTVRLETGRIYVEAVPADKAAGRAPFLVWTPKRKLEALGTHFAVSADDKAMSLLVTQGSVRVEGAPNPVAAGQVLKADGALNEVTPARRASVDLDWLRDLMAAAESPLVPAGKYGGGALVAVDPYGQEAKLSMVKYHVDVHIEDGFARTTIDQTYFNHESFQMEGTFYFPLPPDASLSRLAMYVADGEFCNLMEGGMAERDYARQTYERIRHARRDPALLEWVDGSLFKMRVFPLEARQEKRIILSYTQKLPVQYGRTTYRFPAGHSLSVVKQWSFEARGKGLANLHAASPSHPTMKIEKAGDDLILRDKANGVKVDRDIVLEFNERAGGQAETVRWSSAEHEGNRYLMLRYRPELQGAPKRERRDWVFLFEASGARDPLVARAQAEVVRALLNNAEHNDTFALLTVGTHVHRFNSEPVLATESNVREAMAFLDRAHLIGALNLDAGLSQAAEHLQDAVNPYLVHVGGGIASLGEQRPEKLTARLPAGTKYVGVAVGKRFSPAFMKNAAEKTGGLFTQINPDEPIAWRGFELSAAMNTPRLLNVNVSATPQAAFLPIANAVAQGEEFCAVARIDGETPDSVTVRGVLDGVTFERTLPVRDVAGNAGYLPRTWAKLEIDRLLAEDAGKHRQRIIELSKAMYVMTPFTSLLVLENEAMYKEFKVDRGRKDHWAMYSCPEKVPTVFVPDPNGWAQNTPQFTTRKPHSNVVTQTIMMRAPPQYLTMSGRRDEDAIRTANFNFSSNDGLGIVTSFGAVPGFDQPNALARIASNRFNSWSMGLRVDIPLGRPSEPEQVKETYNWNAGNDEHDFGPPVSSPEPLGLAIPSFGRLSADVIEDPNARMRQILNQSEDLRQIRDERDRFWFNSTPSTLSYERLSGAIGPGDLPPVRLATAAVVRDPIYGDDNLHPYVTGGQFTSLGDLRGRSGATRTLHRWSGGTLNSVTDITRAGLVDAERGWRLEAGTNLYDDADRKSFRGTASGRVFAVLNNSVSGPPYYQRPSFNRNDRVFTDLVSYAPGMSSSPADIQAVLEAEAAPRAGARRGVIDPQARERIERARTTAWRSLSLTDDSGAANLLHFDGTGRFACERRVGLGLVERIICDGKILLHLYPELGIGARRIVSRFHRAEVSAALPEVVLPAEDLNDGCDVRLVSENVVALVPLPPQGDDGAMRKRDKWVETHLVFDGDRLAERRWVEMPAKKELGREVYGADGTIRFLDKAGKEVGKAERTIKPAAEPDLRPDVASLVVLPLPLRSREVVYRKYDLDPNKNPFDGENACFEYLSPDAALDLLACEFAHNNGSRVDDVWYHCFAKHGDRRVGFFTLMQSSGYDPRYRHVFEEVVEKQLRDGNVSPLMRYLTLAFDRSSNYWQRQLGPYPGRVAADNFLDNLLTFRALTLRWDGGHIDDGIRGARAVEKDRAVAFAQRHAADVWGWCVAGILSDRASGREFRKQVADLWGTLAEKSALPYYARYEQAAQLVDAGWTAEGRKLFTKQFAEAFKEGWLPPLDRRFYNAFLDESDGAGWRDLMRRSAAASLAANQRDVVVMLARQCRQLGDRALADELLARALDNSADEQEHTPAVMAAIEYAWAVHDDDLADRLVRELLAGKGAHQPAVWRLAAKVAERRGDRVRQYECLEKALDAEFAHVPEVFDVEPIRRDYGALLQHYLWLAEAAKALNTPMPGDLASRAVRAADRWRRLDPDATAACTAVAKVLRLVGGDEARRLAWDFVTTPLALRPNESEPWLSLAQDSIREGDLALADRCYEAAFGAEPTHAQILWDRAKLLERRGEVSASRDLMRQLAKGDWQPRFEGLKAQARQIVEGR